MNKGKQRFIERVDSMIPDHLKHEDTNAQTTSARLVLVVLLFCNVILFAAVFGQMSATLLSVRDLWVGVVMAAVVWVLFMVLLWDFIKNGNITRTTNLFSFILYSSIAGSVVTTGGWTSPVMFLFLAVPVSIFLIAGRQAGLFWSFAVMTTYFVIFALHKSGVNFMQVMVPGNEETIIALMWAMGCGLAVGCIWLYDRVLQNLAQILSEERERFRHQATHDFLTGVLNREAFQETFDEALGKIINSGGRLCLLRFEIANLKAINTQFDYETGDCMLQDIASIIDESLSEDLVLGRVGTAEFCLMIPFLEDRGTIISVISRLHNVFSNAISLSNGAQLMVQVEMGGVLAPDFSIDPRSLMRGAHDAMLECRESSEGFILR